MVQKHFWGTDALSDHIIYIIWIHVINVFCIFFLFHFISFSVFLSQVADTYTMPTSDGPSHFPLFVAPPNGNHQRSPGYVPGRVAPVRLPLPAKPPPPPPIKPHGLQLDRQAPLSLSEGNQQRAQSLQQRKNTLICCGVSMFAFFLTLILIFSLVRRDVLDGQ